MGYDKLIAGDFDGDGASTTRCCGTRAPGTGSSNAGSTSAGPIAVGAHGHAVYDELIVGDWSAGGDLDETILWDRETGLWVLHIVGPTSGGATSAAASGAPRSTSSRPATTTPTAASTTCSSTTPTTGSWTVWSFHRNVPSTRLSGTWLDGYDVISVGSFMD